MNSLMKKISNKRKRKKLFLFFKEKNYFYKKKLPHSDKYPYTVHHPFDVLETPQTYTKLFLVGDNWLEQSTPKPIALMVGFNNWKYGFVADYLNEYRVAYTVRKLLSIFAARLVFRLNPKPDVIIVWGYEENFIIRVFSKYHNIPLYRMEDGFVRSALLGATHATPYSLILDKKGLYYNPKTSSDLENILNNYDFKNDNKLLDEAKKSLDLILDLKISKYNTPSIHNISKLGLKVKKRVVVLGQVDNDSAIRYGNLDGWSPKELVQLARYENPNAEIIYRPHPEVYKGYQKSKFKKKRMLNLATISSPEEGLIEFLETVDHVYTINSLSGLEALLRGIKVTTVGAAFYGGWGLTDDRYNFERRNKKLSLLELFAGVYLKYPRYLVSQKMLVNGLVASCCKIKADAQIERYNLYKSSTIEDSNILSSPYWVQYLFDNDVLNENFDKIDFTLYLKNRTSLFFQKIYLLSLFGLIKEDNKKAIFLSKVRSDIDYKVYDDFLSTIAPIYDEKLLSKEAIWLSNQDLEHEISKKLSDLVDTTNDIYSGEILDTLKNNNLENIKMKKINVKKLLNSLSVEIDNSNYEDIVNILTIIDELEIDELEIDELEIDELANIKENIKENIFSFYEFYMLEKKFDKALKLAEVMLIFGLHTQTLLSKLTNYAKLRFDFDGARELAQLNQNINLYAQNRNMTADEVLALDEINIRKMGVNNFLIELVKLTTLKPESIMISQDKLQKHIDIFSKKDSSTIIESVIHFNNDITIKKALAYLVIGKSAKSIEMIENLIAKGDSSDKVFLIYIKALFNNNQKKLAISYIEKAIHTTSMVGIFHEAIMLYIETGKFEKAETILALANERKIEINPSFKIKIYQGKRKIKLAYAQYKEIESIKTVKKYFTNKLITSIYDLSPNDKVVVLALYGPGDEIRFASMYNQFFEKTKHQELFFSCAPKLFALFNRSYPHLNFLPVERLRDIYDSANTTNYTALESLELVTVIDNNGMKIINKSDKVVLVTDVLADLIEDYSSLERTKYLIHDNAKTIKYKKILPSNSILVGLNWRSSLNTYSRNMYYLSIQELEPIFTIKDIIFVNLQYDECSEELAWVEERYPGKLINIDELDQYNDLDSVASLVKCMDLIIAPPTSVGELAGALGCETWMFSNSYELNWRKINEEGDDVWHENMKIVDSGNIGNKKSLVVALRNKLISRFNI